jgi:hypothetical protein
LGKQLASCTWLKKEAAEKFVLDKLMSNIFTRDRIREGLVCLMQEQARNEKEDNTERDNIQIQMKQLDVELDRFYKAITAGVQAEALAKPINERLEKKAFRKATI